MSLTKSEIQTTEKVQILYFFILDIFYVIYKQEAPYYVKMQTRPPNTKVINLISVADQIK